MSKNEKSNQDKIAALKNSGSLNPFPEKVRNSFFRENKFFDPNDIVQVKYELLRQVQTEGASVTEATKDFGISRLSYYRTFSAFEGLGLQGLIPQKRGPREAHKLNKKIVEFMKKQIRENPFTNSSELKELLKKNFGLTVHVRSIERALKKKEEKL